MNSKALLMLCVIFMVSCSDDLANDSAVKLVTVYINTAETQCNDDGLSLEETSSYLTDANIEFTEPQCGYITGANYPAVCGGGTSNIYIFTIQEPDLLESENLGFAGLSSLDSSLGYETVNCS
ncbi:hypothetical protein [uncultured Paraglaciecola sp.]|uniref:hypothetical protein n=1 Tax=uncultured Paraglaciecola sp. TaxID=1765024 RepID=UPI00259831D2|nr:hypothetical protein [uncultured Paraglaciecola sp.]